MNEITICQVRNEPDKDLIMLCVEWTELTIKITIFPASRIPLVGEMSDTEIDSFAEGLGKTRVAYVEETRSFLTGKNSNVQFFLQNATFKWKKSPWICGSLELEPVSKLEVLSDILLRIFVRQKDWEQELTSLKRENDELKREQEQQHVKLKEMIDTKNIMEEDLYRRFLLILNAKKLKIRELQSDSQKQNVSSRSVYETKTDESSEDEWNYESTKTTIKAELSNLNKKDDKSENIIVGKKKSRMAGVSKKSIDRNISREKKNSSARNFSAGKTQLGKRLVNRSCKEESRMICPVTSDEENPFDYPLERSIPSSMEMEDNEVKNEGGKSRFFSSEASTSKIPDNGISTFSRVCQQPTSDSS